MGVLSKIRTCAAFLVGGMLAGSVQNYSDSDKLANLKSFELIWKTLDERYWDTTMGGLDWKAIRVEYRRKLEQSVSRSAGRSVLEQMIHLLPSSHLAIIPASLYKPRQTSQPGPSEERSPAQLGSADKKGDDVDTNGSTGISVAVMENRVVVREIEAQSSAAKQAVHAGWTIEAIDGMLIASLFSAFNGKEQPQLVARIAETWLSGPPGSKVAVRFRTPEGSGRKELLTRAADPSETTQFGNLPPEHVRVEHRMLKDDVGYIRLNLFLDPVRVMPEIERAVTEFRQAPGVVFDLRDNPGGIGVMAMGIAGWFVSEEGTRLGTMTSRDSTLSFVVNPRLETYTGKLAVLVNEESASTSEIFAQGMKDLHRAKVFGTKTAGAALPSNIITLPNGDRFQYPDANYTSSGGRVLEGNGVEPDFIVAQTISALVAGKDLVLEAGRTWCLQR